MGCDANLSKDDMPIVQMRSRGRGYEKLGPVGAGALIGHAQKARPVMLQFEVLIRELAPIYGLSTPDTSRLIVSEWGKQRSSYAWTAHLPLLELTASDHYGHPCQSNHVSMTTCVYV